MQIAQRRAMYPNLGVVPAYQVTLVTGVVIATLIGAYGLHRSGLPARDCVRLQVVLTLAGLVGAKLFSLYERGGHVTSLASELLQGYRYPGGIIAVVLAVGALAPRVAPVAVLADALAPSVGIGAAIVRLGCFLGGCCFGVRSALPWALRFPAHSPPWGAHVAAGWIGYSAHASLPVHPLQLYFIGLSLTAAVTALWLQPRKAYAGQVALVFLAVDGVGKFALELLRHEQLPEVQLGSLGIGLAAAATLVATALRRIFVRKHRSGASRCSKSEIGKSVHHPSAK